MGNNYITDTTTKPLPVMALEAFRDDRDCLGQTNTDDEVHDK